MEPTTEVSVITSRISYKRQRFPPDVIRYAVWFYFRFTLSLRDVEELLAERGMDVSYETIRCWAIKFGRSCQSNCIFSPIGGVLPSPA